jgi:cell division protein FtsB
MRIYRNIQDQLIEERRKNAELQERNAQLEQYVNEQSDALIELAEIIDEMGGKING